MKPLVAFLDDLFFTVKIADAAKRAGTPVTFVKTADAAIERVLSEHCLVVIDLNCAASDPIALVARIKAEAPATPVVGFVSHVQTDLREQARVAGCDAVLARSVFSSKLPDVLREYGG